MEYAIQNEALTLTVNARGAELWDLRSTRRPDQPLLWSGQADIWPWRAPVCFPWCGKRRDSCFEDRGVRYPAPQHGFVRELEHQLTGRSDSSLEFCLDWQADASRWPWSFSFRTRFALERSSVRISFHVTNRDRRPMPAQLGYHPGLRCPLSPELEPEDYAVRFEAEEAGWGRTVPIARDMFQNRRILLPDPRSRWAQLEELPTGRFLRLDLTGCRCVVLWSKPDIPGFICIEPWYGKPGTQRELILDPEFQIIQPGQALTYTQTLQLGVPQTVYTGAAYCAVSVKDK